MSKRPASSPPGSKQAHQPISSSHLTFGSQSGDNSAEKYGFIFLALQLFGRVVDDGGSVWSLLTGLKACGTLPWWPIFPMRLCVHLPCMLTFPSSLPFLCLAAFLLPDFLKETASCLVPDWEKPAAPPRAWDIKLRHRGGGAGARPQARQLLLVNTLTGVCPGVTRTGSDGQV